MKTKFTPGPWPIKRDGNTVISIGKIGANEYAGEAWLDISCADACLVEAAPDLYAALELILDREEISEDYIKEQAIAVLKKARGEQ
jgi:hypothetical protein